MPEETDDIEYVVTKTTTEMFVALAANAEEAEKAVANGQGELVQRNTSSNVRPRNVAPIPAGQRPTQPGTP